MSHPCSKPPEFAKYTVSPTIATEFSMETSLSPMLVQKLLVPAGRVEHELGRDSHLAVGSVPRLSFTMWNWLFSPPSNK